MPAMSSRVTRIIASAMITARNEIRADTVTVVASGWGDGVYPTFVGCAPSGTVSSFITDFMVVPDAAEAV